MAFRERWLSKNSSLFVLLIVAFMLSQIFIIATWRAEDDTAHRRQVLSPSSTLQKTKPSVRAKKHQQNLIFHEKKRSSLVHNMNNNNRTAQAASAARNYANQFRKFGKGPLNFFHLPKTAGTAVEEAAAKQEIPWGSCRFYHKPKRDICPYPSGPEWPKHVGWWHLPAYLFPLASANPYQSTDLFAIVRNPYERLVSEFYYICTLKVKDWRPDQCDNRTRLFDADYFNAWLSRKLQSQQVHHQQGRQEGKTSQEYLADNGHFTAQHDFLVGPHQVRVVDYVLRMDDTVTPLAEQFARLVTSFGNNMTLSFMGAISAGERNTTQHLTIRHLDQPTLDWIHRLYPHDFDRLGYSRMGKQ